MPKVLNAEEFKSDVLESKGPVLVDFFATWCGPCKLLGPILENIAPEYEGKLPIYKLDIDQNPSIAQQYRVLSVPTMKIFKDGEVVDTIIGLQPENALKEKLNEYVD